jgi:glucose-6-phosphate 1-epimerase
MMLFLALTPKAVVLSKYPFPCKLLYTVTLAEHQLTTHLHVENIGTDSLSFQALLHTYHRVPAAATTVTPLKGLSYINKVKSGEVAIENRDGVDVREFTDSIYLNANGDYEIVWDGKPRIQIRAHAFPDVVVWNPAQEAGSKLNDMEDGGW